MAGDGRLVLVATRNSGKFGEWRGLFASLGYRTIDLDRAGIPASPAEAALEQFATFRENAIAKARYYYRASGQLPVVADDSGLVVTALGGAPGVWSRRWAGATGSEADVSAANNRKLIAELARVPTREARLVCVVAWVDEHRTLVEQGEIIGRIARSPRGENGFGYDPLFEVPELGERTFAEAAAVQKAAISHRARAFARLARALHRTA